MRPSKSTLRSELRQRLGQVDQHLVAAGQQIVSVDLLEMVDVDQAEGQRAGIAVAAAQLALGQAVHGPAVGQVRQRIGQGQLFEHLVLLLELVIGFFQGLIRLLRRAFAPDAIFQLGVQLRSSSFTTRSSSRSCSWLRSRTKVRAARAQRIEQLLGPPRLEDVAKDLAAVDGLDGFFQLGEAGHHQPHRSWDSSAGPIPEAARRSCAAFSDR